MPLSDESHETLAGLLSRSLSQDNVKASLVFMLTEMVGESKVSDALKKAAMFKDITLLRILTLLIYNSDPFAFRNVKVEDCECKESDGILELRLVTDEGDLCVAYTVSPPFISTSFKLEREKEAKSEEAKEIKLKIA